MTVRVYTASKLYMYEAWQELRVQQVDVEFTARWIDQAEKELGDARSLSASFYEQCWIEDEADVRRADVVLVYGATDDMLVGALVEAGMGIALEKTVICVGNAKGFGTWVHHPNVYRAKTVIEALELAKKLFP